MNNFTKILLVTIAAIFVGIGVIIFSDRMITNNRLSDLNQNEQILYILRNNGCMSCHSENPQLPFYASLPVAKNMIATDVQNGYRYLNLDNLINELENDGQPSQVDIAKIEQSVINGTMPPLKYKAMHWTASLDRTEKKILMDWVRDTRLKYYDNGLSAEAFVGHPILPLVDGVEVNEEKVKLGFDLYHDVRLSKNNTISCATCHPLDAAGVDGLQFSKGIYDQIGGINAPTVYNSGFNVAQFWDGRKSDLAAQAGGPPFDALEMGSESWEEIMAKLAADKNIVAQFNGIYPDGMTGDNIMNAIAEFEKTLITPNSRFDLYLKGDVTAMNEQEIQGYDLFRAYNCASCHVGQAMGGQSFEYMGIVKDYFANREMKADREIIQIKDQGLFNATGDNKHMGYFKTPSLRNVAMTAPYLHDGTATTLEDATRIMLEYQVGREASDDEINKMVMFMNTLTGQYKGVDLDKMAN